MTLHVDEQLIDISLEAMIPTLLAGFGFEHSKELLFTISREDAQDTVSHLIAYDLAYSYPTDAIDVAEECGRDFVSLFSDDSQFFTNSSESIDSKSRSWQPLTSATFDSGILAISKNRVGIIWFEDED